MPRAARIAPGGLVYHVLNRANGRTRLFRKPADYEMFVETLGEAIQRMPMRMLGFCVMPDHWHLLLWPRKDGDLSNFLRWLTNTHVRRFHQRHNSFGQGHIYQGRFKSFPVQEENVPPLLRYIESNPVRSKLVKHPGKWAWSSLTCRQTPQAKLPLLSAGPVQRPKNWATLVAKPLDEATLQAARTSVIRGRPFGDANWTAKQARKLGLQFSLNPRGRPPKAKADKAKPAKAKRRRR
jgi:putative transposase